MKRIAALLLCAACAPAQMPEEKQVLAAVQRLFDAMAAKDAAAALAVVAPEGRYYALRAQSAPVGATLREFAERLPSLKEPVREVMRQPQVQIRGRIATVWTPYDFYRNGKRTHGGVDAFSLVHTGGGWRIVALIYTVEP